MRLLDFVEQDHRVRVPLHLLGELPALFVPHVPRRRADQLADRVLLHVLRHVEADERMVAAEQQVGQGARQLGLADTRRPEEQEAAHRARRRLQARPRPPDGAGHGRNGPILADDAVVQLLFHPEQLVALVLVDRGEGHPRPLRDDLVDLGAADRHAAMTRRDVELLADELQVLASHDFLLAEELGALEVLLRDRTLHLLDRHPDVPVDLAELLAEARLAQLGPRPGLVEQVDGLVGQEPVGDVAARLVDRGLERLTRVVHVMERLVALLDAEQDLDRLALAGRIDLDGLEAALERPVLLDVLAVLGGGRRPDAPDLAPRQRGLEDVGGVQRAFGRPGPHQRVQLVDEHDDVRVLDQLLHDRLQALFELPAILRARDDQRDVEGENPLVGQEVRHVADGDLLRQTFDDGGLADAGLADEDGVVLGAAAEHLLDALDLRLAPDQRVEGTLERRLAQVAAELREQRRLLDPRHRRLLVEERDDVLAHGGEAHALLHEDGRGDRLLLTEDAEQEMLGPDVVVRQLIGFLGRELQHALGLGAEGNLDRGRDLLAEDRAALDLLADGFEGEVRARENPARQPLALADQAQQQVLGLDRDTAQLAGLIPGEEEDAPRSFCIPLEHVVPWKNSRRLAWGAVCRHYTGCSSAGRPREHPCRQSVA